MAPRQLSEPQLIDPHLDLYHIYRGRTGTLAASRAALPHFSSPVSCLGLRTCPVFTPVRHSFYLKSKLVYVCLYVAVQTATFIENGSFSIRAN